MDQFLYLVGLAILIALVFIWVMNGWKFRPIKAIKDQTSFKNFFRVLIGRPRHFYMRAEVGMFGVTLNALEGMKTSFRQFIRRMIKS